MHNFLKILIYFKDFMFPCNGSLIFSFAKLSNHFNPMIQERTNSSEFVGMSDLILVPIRFLHSHRVIYSPYSDDSVYIIQT